MTTLPVLWFIFWFLCGFAFALAATEIADARQFNRDWHKTEERVARILGAVRGL